MWPRTDIRSEVEPTLQTDTNKFHEPIEWVSLFDHLVKGEMSLEEYSRRVFDYAWVVGFQRGFDKADKIHRHYDCRPL